MCNAAPSCPPPPAARATRSHRGRRGEALRAGGGPAGASGPRVRLRTEAGASLWCSGPPPPPPPAALGQRLEGQAALRGSSSSGKQKVLLSGVGPRSREPPPQSPRARRARRHLGNGPARPSPRSDPGPRDHAGGIPHCSGMGRALGVTATPTPNPQRRARVASGRASPFMQLRSSLLALGGGGGRARGASAGDTAGTAEETSRNWQTGAPPPPPSAGTEPASATPSPRAGAWTPAARCLPGPSLCALGGGGRDCVRFQTQERQVLGCWAPPGSQPPTWREQEGYHCLGLSYSKWKKKCEKVVQYFSCKGYYST